MDDYIIAIILIPVYILLAFLGKRLLTFAHGYEKGLEDAEKIRKMTNLVDEKRKTPKHTDEIKIGDEVTVEGVNGIAVREPYPIGSDKEMFVLIWYGQRMSSSSLKNVALTGRYFPQITEVLEQLKRR